MPRFVVLRHDVPGGAEMLTGGRALHWDIMLETGTVLRTWALAEPPQPAGMSCFAERLADHRLLYLDYEGEVSGGRGTVSRLDAGDYTAIGNDESAVVVKVNGSLLKGTATLSRCAPGDQRWRFAFVSEGTAASGLSCPSTAGDPSDSRGTV
ncbi:MAG TPA: DNA polymerase ligase N-terminal domain-containing protein [Pirellulales bacterium]|nr:DNA polymerase ligase N-terminal domain-containing protein [Pirellulales bacterium]